MNSELIKGGFNFDSVWDRMVQITGWKNYGQLAEFLGITSASVSGAKGRGFMSLEWIFKVARGFNVSTDWLATGVESIKQDDAACIIAESRAQYATATDLEHEYVMVPRYNVKVSLGGGSQVESEQVVDYLAFKSDWIRNKMHLNPANLVLVSAIGDSMFPTLRDGDLVLLDKSKTTVTDDAIYVLRFDGHLIAKRLQKLFDGGIQVKSDNAVYDAQTVPAERIQDLAIIGKVVWIGGRV